MTATKSSPTPKQDPEIKGNPYSARYSHERRDHYEPQVDQAVYFVQSASSDDKYPVFISDADPERDRCGCLAHGHCWHIDAARLRREIDRVAANSAALYHTWQLAELADEDERLRAVLAEADSYLVRAQLGVVGDRIAELLDKQVAA